MCCYKDPKTTTKFQQRIKPFNAYKVIRPLGPHQQDKPELFQAIHGVNHAWGPGIHIPHQTHKEYSSNTPHGFHFYLKKTDAQAYRDWYHPQCLILQITVNPKDVIAVEPKGADGYRQGVATEVNVSQKQWNKVLKERKEKKEKKDKMYETKMITRSSTK